jgi:membrane protein YdbS with pleckstrin-like domain
MTMTNHPPEPQPTEPAPANPANPANPATREALPGDGQGEGVTPAATADSLAVSLATPTTAPEPAEETPGRLDVGGEWRRVSSRTITIELIGDAILVAAVAGIACFLWFLIDHPWPLVVGGAIVLVTLVTAAFVPRRIRSIGYRLRHDDLLFRRGIMWQRFVAVPYGRMQLVDINRGPLARAFGLAELKFVTASPTAGVTIPGLPLEEAENLRDHLVSVAESRRTGL